MMAGWPMFSAGQTRQKERLYIANVLSGLAVVVWNKGGDIGRHVAQIVEPKWGLKSSKITHLSLLRMESSACFRSFGECFFFHPAGSKGIAVV